MQHAKPMLSVDEQLDHLAEKGITYDIISRHDAGIYLSSANNYFRLAAYRMLFPNLSDEPGVDLYEGVDFAHLSEIASSDNQLRYVLLHMMLDVEHYAKVRLLAMATICGEDGYSIVRDFCSTPRGSHIMQDVLKRSAGNSYTEGLYNKYKDEMPVWVLFELISYTQLCKFYDFCGSRWDDLTITDEAKIYTELISMRNAVAHSNCLLNGIEAESGFESRSRNTVLFSLYNNIANRDMVLEIIESPRLTQVSILFLLHKGFAIGEDSRKRTAEELKALRHELDSRFAMFEDFDPIVRRLNLLCDLITLWQTA